MLRAGHSMAMGAKINYRAIGIQAVLCLLLSIYLSKSMNSDVNPDVAGTALTNDFSLEEIEQISITIEQGQRIQLNKNNGRWFISEPYQVPADEALINELLDAFAKTRIMEIIDAKPGDLTSYGLDRNQRVVLSFSLSNGTEHTYFIGSHLPLNKIYVYFQKDGSPEVYRVWEGVNLVVQKHRSALLRGKPVSFIPSEVAELVLKDERGELSLQKRDNKWVILNPNPYPADPDAVTLYLESLLNVTTVGDYLHESLSEERLNQKNQIRIAVRETSSDDGINIDLIPAEEAQLPLLVIQRDGDTAVYETDTNTAAKLEFVPASFYLNSAIDLDSTAITNIRIARNSESIELTRSGDTSWVFDRPDTGQIADVNMIDRFLHAVENIRVESYLTTEEHTSSTGPAHMTITFSSPNESTVFQVFKDHDTYHAVSSSHPDPFSVNPEAFEVLDEFNVDSFQDHHLLEFDPTAVTQVRVTGTGKTVEIVKRDNTWQLAKPVRMNIRNPVAWRFIFSLKDIQYTEIVYETISSDNPGCTEEDPGIVVEIVQKTSDKGEAVRLELHKTTQGIVAGTSRSPGCYRVDEAVWEDLVSIDKTLSEN